MSDEDNRPLASIRNGQNGVVSHYEDDSDDDSEDNMPLMDRMRREAALTRAAPTSPEGGDEEDSDDDVPLALRVRQAVPAAPPKRTARPHGVSKAPPVKRKRKAVKNEPKREPKVRRQPAKAKTEAVIKKPRVKKEEDVKFEMPGQKRETPPENDPARLFYQSMYHEKVRLGKKSDIATSWMLRHGLLEEKVAKKLAK